jgi:carboxypeptidase Taq
MREVALLTSCETVLNWDQDTHMPPKASPYRAEQRTYLTAWAHRLSTAPEVGDWISACEQRGFPADSKEAVNVREWRRSYDRQARLPTELVEEFQRARSIARDAWVEARRRSDFTLFQQHLENIIELTRRMADCWGYEASPYDALLEEYEPGARSGSLRQLFAELKPAIASLRGAVVERSARIPQNLLEGDYPVSAQQAFNREVAEAMGYDFAAGRIDTTIHPFYADLGPRDRRITARYDEKDFTRSLYGILHEAGHALYEQGFNPEDYGTPMARAASLGIHESQSRLWENHVGRSEVFWEHWHPAACRNFPGLARFSPAQIAAAVSRVAPSFSRVEADQVTYDLHIILRFEIEVSLLEGDMKVADVPGAWNEAFEKTFGLKVPNDAQGCLQDVHWSIGILGYFPTYTLGNLNAAQLFRRACRDHPDLESELKRGQYATLLAWLREKIHQQGQRYRPQDLMQFATGEPTRAAWHLANLRRRFAA